MLFSRKRDELRAIEVERVVEFMTVGDREMNGRGCLKFCAEKKSLIIVNFPKHSQVWGVSKQTLYFQQVLHACSVCHFSSWITSLPTCCVCLISLLIMFHFFQLFSSCVRSVFVPNVLNLNCSLLCCVWTWCLFCLKKLLLSFTIFCYLAACFAECDRPLEAATKKSAKKARLMMMS